jgi:SNF2 family DNA or RNA helicase
MKVCEKILGLRMGALMGSSIFDHKSSNKYRAMTVDALNEGELDGLVMTDKVGACGHNLVGASHMIFMGSLYSPSNEEQAIGISLS